MSKTRLSEDEISALAALVAHLICADNAIKGGEAREMSRLAREAGIPGLNDRIVNCLNQYPTPAIAIDNAKQVKGAEARAEFLAILDAFAASDGLRARCETQIIDDLRAAWD